MCLLNIFLKYLMNITDTDISNVLVQFAVIFVPIFRDTGCGVNLGLNGFFFHLHLGYTPYL